MTPKVKICGLIDPQDARLAEALGADYIGLVFEKSSRVYVDIDQAKKITAVLDRAKPVGVMVDQSYEESIEIAEKAGLWGIQHYTYFDQGFRTAGFAYIYAARLGAPNTPENFSSLKYDYLLLDSYDKKKYGGTGKTFDWGTIPNVDRARLFLAGGLGPDNICAAAREKTFALDLSSSVEAEPKDGVYRKDPEKLKKLFSNFQACT